MASRCQLPLVPVLGLGLEHCRLQPHVVPLATCNSEWAQEASTNG